MAAGEPAVGVTGDAPALCGSDSRSEARHNALSRTLTGRFCLRAHMSVMLAAAFAIGFAADKLLVFLLPWVPLRWLVALVCGYSVFFVCMRFWLAYVGVRPLLPPNIGRALDGIGSGGSSGGGSGGGFFDGVSRTGASFLGGGGRAGGAGASAAFDSDMPTLASSGSAGGSGLGDALNGVGDALGDSDDVGKIVLLVILVLAVVTSLAGGAIYLIVAAPHLLVDVAFGAAITGGFAHGVRNARDSGWPGSVFRSTWKPFLVVALLVLIAGFAFQHYFPGAHTLGQAWLAL